MFPTIEILLIKKWIKSWFKLLINFKVNDLFYGWILRLMVCFVESYWCLKFFFDRRNPLISWRLIHIHIIMLRLFAKFIVVEKYIIINKETIYSIGSVFRNGRLDFFLQNHSAMKNCCTLSCISTYKILATIDYLWLSSGPTFNCKF